MPTTGSFKPWRGALPDDTTHLRRLANLHLGPLVAVLFLALVGLVIVASASSEQTVDYLPRQVVWVVVGLLALSAVFFVDYHHLVDGSPVLYGLGLVALVVVLVVGHEAGGAKSWIAVGPFTVQPSELQKLVTVLFLARFLAGRRQPHLTLREIAVGCVIVAVPVVLVVLERDMGTAAMYMPMLGAMLLVAGVRPRQLLAAGLLGAVLAFGVWSFGMKEYQRQRISSFLRPGDDPLGSGYQVRQSQIAVGSGQWTGRGYGQGTQSQLRFLPARHSDFVMAVWAEERGFLGSAFVLALYSLYFFSATQIAARSRDRAGILVVVGLAAIVASHVIYNTGMVVGLLPITGIPLPFLSYGGSFMLFNFLATGVILNVDYRRYVNR